jgi:hypothetical protein
VLEAVQKLLDNNPHAMRQRRETAEHPFGTLKMRMGAMHLLMKRLPKVATEMATRLQLHTSDEHYGYSAADGRDQGIAKAKIRKPLASPPGPVRPLTAKRFDTAKTLKRHARLRIAAAQNCALEAFHPRQIS